MANLSRFIRFHAERAPERTAYTYKDSTVSYGEFMRRIGYCGGWLSSRGIRPGDVVAVLMKNSAAFLDLAFAVSHVGAVFLPINFRLSASEVNYIVENSGARLLLADDELAGSTSGAGIETVILDEFSQADATRLWGVRPPVAAVPAFRKPQDLLRLMYTSGTTDHPKGVTHSYDNFYWKSADHIQALQLNDQSRLFVGGPLYHVGAFDLPGIAVLSMGGRLSVHREFSPDAMLEAVERESLTCAWLAPVMTTAVLSHAERDRFDVSSLRWVIGGGERTPEVRIRTFSDVFRNARYIDAYGLTESCSGDTLMEAGREIEKIGSVGRALAFVDVRIRRDDGSFAPPGTEGEICLRGPKITHGYWRDPVKTAASFDGDWFLTGDVGYLDADGFLFITDRKKDMIISGGENIASSEVERVILELPEIGEVAVIGIADEKWGERPVAVVVPCAGSSVDAEGLTRHCRERLAGFKVPKAVIVRSELPRNPSGKVLKRVLREMLAEA